MQLCNLSLSGSATPSMYTHLSACLPCCMGIFCPTPSACLPAPRQFAFPRLSQESRVVSRIRSSHVYPVHDVSAEFLKNRRVITVLMEIIISISLVYFCYSRQIILRGVSNKMS